ncbi:MAG: TonB-dependent receptor, partial [Gammaproteobacteria bacterium]
MPHRIRSLIFLPLLIAFESHAESGLEDVIGLEQVYLQDLPIVLSATRLAQPLSEAPVAMTVIDREMIEASGARTIPDLLRLVPGFQVGYFDGNSPVATYHGHGEEYAKQLQVLVDGRSVYVPSRNAVPWSDLVVSIDDIERIEVIRGPNAATYGSNSFMAVVSITTRHAIESQGHYARVRTGSQDTNDAVYEFGAQSGKLDYRVTLSTTNDDGTDALPDDTEADAFNYRLDYQIDSNSTLMYKGGYKEAVYGEHVPAPAADPLAGHDTDTTTAYQHIKWEHQLDNKDSVSLQYYYNYNRYQKAPLPTTYSPDNIKAPDSLISLLSPFGLTQTSPPLTLAEVADYVDANVPPSILTGDQIRFDPFDFAEIVDITSERHDIEFNHYLNPSDDLRLVWGLSARQDIVTAPTFFDEPGTQRLNMYRAFSHGEWKFATDWLLNAGYMIEDNDISGNNRSPRLALIHHLNPNHTIRLGMSKATRTP